MPASMSASLSSPRARSPATASALVVPAGSRRPNSPEKIRSVAWPRILGPTTLSPTLTTASSSTATAWPRSGPIRRASRLADGPKLIDFWPTMPPPNGPRPGPGPATTRSVSFIGPEGSAAGLGGGHAASSAVSWDRTISW